MASEPVPFRLGDPCSGGARLPIPSGMSSDAILRGGIRLPCSAVTRADRYRSFAKVLCRVDGDASTGFGFEGQFVRPGAIVTPAELHPSPEYPENPVLLEYAAQGLGKGTGHNRRAQLYILWRYHSDEWREIGRAASESWDWALDLGPMARRAISESRTAVVTILPDFRQITVRISKILDEELRALEARDRERVLGILHDELACRVFR